MALLLKPSARPRQNLRFLEEADLVPVDHAPRSPRGLREWAHRSSSLPRARPCVFFILTNILKLEPFFLLKMKTKTTNDKPLESGATSNCVFRGAP